MGPYRVEKRCSDCYHEDPQGCWDGGSHMVDRDFTTPEDAAVYAEREEQFNVVYRILDADGRIVRLSLDDYPSQEWHGWEEDGDEE